MKIHIAKNETPHIILEISGQTVLLLPEDLENSYFSFWINVTRK